ncbi:hypothetical protein SCORR_v1c04480 [Spiroplasma corruscae]|uniref:Uncharacterized protein n=1 Tax=Spiroplasma corruscae TaxID=216934 RepID=A0A222ENY4_9MOLU|nr:hypothetical protein [Spiroplasma corruscae]ASP28220.1 hypothetical protein SCORR_v1c04480 [Spiroplasma corruscae]
MKKSSDKVTSDKVAKEASEVLKDKKASKKMKSVAGSALSQAKSKKNK